MSSISSIPSLISSRKSFTDQSVIITNDQSPVLNDSLKLIDLILTNQEKALKHLVLQYRHSPYTKIQLKNSIMFMNNSIINGGKLVVSGMGKSFKIASKFVATLNSLSIHSASLHPSDALHGDLGILRDDHGDVLLLISASGDSPELLNMLNYIPDSINVILLTCNKISKLSTHKKVNSLLYAELPNQLNEKNIYGLSAPTISTTLCLSLLDAVAISLAELQIKDLSIRQKRFGDRHPGGAIGISYQKDNNSTNIGTINNNTLTNTKNTSSANTNTNLSTSSTNSNLFSSPSSLSSSSEERILPVDNKDILINIMSKDIQQTTLDDDNEDGDADADNDNLVAGEIDDFDSEVDTDILEIKDLRLLNEIKTSTSKIEVLEFPSSELEFLKLTTLYDYIIISSLSKVLLSEEAKLIYKSSKLQNDEWDEINWKIQNTLVAISI